MSYANDLKLQIQSRLSIQALKDQILKIMPAIATGVFFAMLTTGLTVLTAILTDNPIWKIAKDPAEVMRFPPYIGMLSNIGSMLWAMTASICLFGAHILKQHSANRTTYRFLLASGFVSLFLGVDDLFLLHEQIFPRLFHIQEDVFYILYLMIIVGYLLYFLPYILNREYLLLGVSVLLFGLSRKLFITLPFLNQFMTTSDGLKHVGIIFWLIFFYRIVAYEVGTLISKPKAG